MTILLLIDEETGEQLNYEQAKQYVKIKEHKTTIHKGKGIKYQGEKIRRKEGKKVVAAKK